MKKILSIIFCFIMCLVFVGCENNKLTQLKKELCYYNYQIENNYDTPETCFKALLSLKMVQEENETSINRKSFSLDYDEEEKLKEYNDEKFVELATQILNNTTVNLEFSDYEIIKTFAEDGYLISCIGDNYDKAEYKYAFSSFLCFFRDEDFGTVDNIKYEYDCVYYICNTLYPKTFNQGIKDTFLGIGIVCWGSSGEETLEETISYVSSSPEGITPYESYIITARTQLADKNAEEDKKPKHYCIECGSKANYSYKSPFSGQTEWYCYSCYKELQELLDRFGMN